MRSSFARGAAGAALLAGFLAAPAGAQSVLASRGLGYPVEPLDARSRGLGGVTTGLADPTPSLLNPASVAGTLVYGFLVSMQPDRYDATAGSVTASGTTVRFPVLMAVIPASSRLALQVGYGSYLDQHWAVEEADSIDLSSGRVGVQDRFASSGGIARFQAGAGYRLTDRLSVGLALDVFTGAAHDSSQRTITGFLPAQSEVIYSYSGLGAGLGARWQPSARTSVSAAVHGGGHIRAESDSLGNELKEYSNPLSVDAGGSARIGSATTVVLSGRWAGWSAANDALSASSGGARDAAAVAGGVEYTGLSLFRKTMPLRVGGRYGQLPFRWSSTAEFPTERAVSAGLGLGLGGGAASLDASAERGWRGGAAAGVDEPYWRFSFSLRVLGR
ncbi:hypothetical protein SAMN05216486_11524 [bacterium JGI 053]|nr:hypothetical protein SAMN05216486_11524 [bacterium JGI 053]